jgi:hypothetical protein
MSKNKYYTPTLEELLSFIVNEKYILSKEDNIIKFNDITTDLRYFIQSNDVESGYKGRKYSINPENYKIKHLDAEDIESFGFERVISTEEGWFHIFENGITLQLQYLNRNNSKGTIRIEQGMFNQPWPVVFWGVIKNKSELKKVLQMIGVLEDE